LIGKPIGNTDIYILDDYLRLLPVGVKGEIYIAGDNLSRGYLNRPDLTNEKFMDHPFKNGERIYKSGDVGCWDADGNIEFFGRRDNQVKIRGHRIELGEVETVLNLHEKVKQAVVNVQKSRADQDSLVAYYTGVETDTSLLKAYLTAHLPAHMVPSHIVYMDRFPLNPNGKVDRLKLQPVDIQQSLLSAYEAPRTKTEEQLVTIWQNLFGIERIGIRDNFFEIGGHSLLAMRLVSAIRKELNAEIPIRIIFTLFTIMELADYIESTFTNCLVGEEDYEEIQL
jgi:acyl carrier protein